MQKAIRKGLLPCPHCGGRAGLWQAYDSSWCVQCDRCGASTMRFDKDEVIKRWNRRVGHDNQRTERKRTETEVERTSEKAGEEEC